MPSRERNGIPRRGKRQRRRASPSHWPCWPNGQAWC